MSEQLPRSPAPEDPITPNPHELPPQEHRTWAMICHLSGLAGYLPVIPGLGNVIAPLVVWLIKKDQMPFVDDQGKQVLNFKITMLIAAVVLGILTFIPLVFCITVPLLLAVVVVDVVFTCIAAVKANNGELYRYPLAIRFVE